jgi:predicted 3-demethylubiquinone-9 3-methyltransferase (glyoxalase superfamily)
VNNTIHPCLWFDKQAKDAAEFYCSVFGDGKIIADNPVVVNFDLNGQKFMALNGGPKFKINPSVSFFVVCETEDETLNVWNKLLEGGKFLMPLDKYPWSEKYGWVEDKFGVSWQISLGKIEDVGQKYTPALLFIGPHHGKAEEALRFYTSIFPNSSITGILHYKEGDENGVAGTVQHAQFNLNKYVMMVMDNGYPHEFAMNEAVSFVVTCDTQEEIDYYWNKLTEGGEESMCGWLKDKFGVWWQIIPSILEQLMQDPARSERVTKEFLQMRKFDIEKLLHA